MTRGMAIAGIKMSRISFLGFSGGPWNSERTKRVSYRDSVVQGWANSLTGGPERVSKFDILWDTENQQEPPHNHLEEPRT